MIKKLFVSDMDGTFLREDHQFHRERFHNLIQRFREKGYLFVPASGRSLLSLQDVFKGFEEDIAFIAENGSLASYKGEMIYEDRPIAPSLYLDMIKQIEEGPYGSSRFVVLSGKSGAYLLKSADPSYVEMIAQFYLQTYLVSDFSEVEEDIIKVIATFPDDDLEEAQNWLNTNLEGAKAITTGFNTVDIVLLGRHKAVALSKLCQHFGLEAKDVVAFGDNQNDLEMLSFAGTAIATCNAKKEIKDIADKVIGHCNDGAVLAYMEEMVE